MSLEFDPKSHTYSVDGVEYTSVTSWVKSHFKPFDADEVIDKMMASDKWPESKYFDMSKEEILAQWAAKGDEARTAGTKLHEDIEAFYCDEVVDNDTPEYHYFQTFIAEHPEYKHLASEYQVFDPETRIAGTIDALYEDERGFYVIVDWKRSETIKRGGKVWDWALTKELPDMPDEKFYHYSLQLNMYKYLIERVHPDMDVRVLKIVQLHPSKHSYVEHDVKIITDTMNTLMGIRKKKLNCSENIRVGRRIYDKTTGSWKDPSYEGFTPVIVMTDSTKYGSLSPFVLKDERGVIMENAWQASKVYPDVPATTQTYSRYDSRVIWKRGAEVHAIKKDNGWAIQPAYMKWRRDLMSCKYAVRYPVGYHHRHKCLFAFADDEHGNMIRKPLNYIESRKAIYVPLYTRLVKQEKQYEELRQRLMNGEKLLIIEADACHQESLSYYMKEYDVPRDFIEGDTMLATEKNLSIMLNDEKHPYGHSFVLASALLGLKID